MQQNNPRTRRNEKSLKIRLKNPAVVQCCKMAQVLPVIKSVDLSRKTNAGNNICYGNEYRFSFGASEGGGGRGHLLQKCQRA